MMIFAKIAKESVITRTFPFGGGVPNVTSLGERQLELEDLHNYSKLAMDEDHEVRDSNRSDTEGDAESDLDSDRVSPSEESGDSSEELTGASLAPYSFEPSDSASASPDDDDDARDERLSDFGKRNRLTPSLYVLLQPAATQRFTIVRFDRSFNRRFTRSTVVYLHAVYRERVPLVTSRSSPASNRMYYPVLV